MRRSEKLGTAMSSGGAEHAARSISSPQVADRQPAPSGIAAVGVTVAATRISAGLRIERGFNRIDMTAKSLDHRLDDVVGSDADAVAEQLHRQMAVAEVPGDADEFSFVVGVNLKQRFGLRANANHPARGGNETVAIPQTDRLGQIDQHLGPGYRCQDDTSAEAAVVVDQHVSRSLASDPRFLPARSC